MFRILAVLLALFATTDLSAQQRAPEWRRWRPPALQGVSGATASTASTFGLAAAGLGGGAVGVVAGGLIGAAIGGGNSICGDDACGLEEAAYGAVIGESVLLPLGVHLANGRRGNYGLSLLASAAIGAAGVLAVDAANDGSPLIAVPVLQLVSSILIERATGRR